VKLKLFTTPVLVALSLHAGFAQINCDTQVKPIPPAACAYPATVCLCDHNGMNCHWRVACQQQQGTSEAPPIGNDGGALGGLMQGIIRGRQMRQQKREQEQPPLVSAPLPSGESDQAGAFSDQPDHNELLLTYGLPNGRWWKVVTSGARQLYVMGLRDGMSAGCLDQDGKYRALGVCWILEPVKNVTMPEIIDQISLFYADPLNIPLPVASVQMAALERLGGAPEADVSSHLEAMRKAIRE
jgi:hypothetical protein